MFKKCQLQVCIGGCFICISQCFLIGLHSSLHVVIAVITKVKISCHCFKLLSKDFLTFLSFLLDSSKIRTTLPKYDLCICRIYFKANRLVNYVQTFFQ